MSKKKISQLPDADLPLSGSEYLEIVQNGTNKKVQKSDISSGGGGGNFSITDWDMSASPQRFPSNSERGQRYYGINGPTSTLLDRQGNIIPDGVILTSLENNASTTDPTKWAIQYTII